MSLVSEDHDKKYHRTVRGVVTKLSKKKGEITSKNKVYKFTTAAVYSEVKLDMLVDMLLAYKDFVTRVDGVH
ncbi:MAG: hypothetical protein HOB15_01765 [Flavobacteriales bacterium]|jgi:hypothetical protein|nr:hypothetical protein [Flavobacteriales bacterium]